jgi:hypothetical protein
VETKFSSKIKSKVQTGRKRMGNWTVKKVPITAHSGDVEEREGTIEGQGSVMLEDCPFKQEVKDQTGKVLRIECADDAGVRECDPDNQDCKLQQWMESVKAFIRQIDVDAL